VTLGLGACLEGTESPVGRFCCGRGNQYKDLWAAPAGVSRSEMNSLSPKLA